MSSRGVDVNQNIHLLHGYKLCIDGHQRPWRGELFETKAPVFDKALVAVTEGEQLDDTGDRGQKHIHRY